MFPSIRQSMAFLHTWAGLLAGWVLFVVFCSGTAAYFNGEISRWMRPELGNVSDPLRAMASAEALLKQKMPDGHYWFVGLPGGRSNATHVYWEAMPATPDETEGEEGNRTLDGTGADTMVRDTEGGDFLYRFHFDLRYMPAVVARWIVGACAMFMLVAIISGIITHKKIFADFFMLRFGKGQRSWLDAHNAASVLALPFHLMITYTGLASLMFLYMPWGIDARYDEPETFYSEAWDSPAHLDHQGRPAPLVPVTPLVERARPFLGGEAPAYVFVEHPGDISAVVEISTRGSDGLSSARRSVIFDGTTGTILHAGTPGGGAAETLAVMIGLHAGRYADTGLRWLYFLSGLGGTAMVATGLLLWTAKRRRKTDAPAFGFRLVEALNIATITGLPAGIAAYLLANRLLPLAMTERAEAEILALFVTWALALFLALVRPARRAWGEGLGLAALAFLSVPAVNALTTSRGLAASLAAGDGAFIGVDLTTALIGAGFAFAARRAVQPRAAARTSRRVPSAAAQP